MSDDAPDTIPTDFDHDQAIIKAIYELPDSAKQPNLGRRFLLKYLEKEGIAAVDDLHDRIANQYIVRDGGVDSKWKWLNAPEQKIAKEVIKETYPGISRQRALGKVLTVAGAAVAIPTGVTRLVYQRLANSPAISRTKAKEHNHMKEMVSIGVTYSSVTMLSGVVLDNAADRKEARREKSLDQQVRKTAEFLTEMLIAKAQGTDQTPER